MGKRISSNQELEQRSRNELKSVLEGWAVNDLENDFGLDFVVQLASPSRDHDSDHLEITSLSCYIQLKSSESFESDSVVKRRFETSFVDSYWQSSVPVALVFYEDSTESLYWGFLQDYYWKNIYKETPEWKTQETITITIPRDQELSQRDAFGTHIEECTKRIQTRHYKRRALESNRFLTHSSDPAAGAEHIVAYIKNRLDSRTDIYTLHLIQNIINNIKTEKLRCDILGMDSYSILFDLHDCCKSAASHASDQGEMDLADFFREEAEVISSALRESLVGNRYLNCEVGEEFTVVSTGSVVPDDSAGRMFTMAYAQYEDGVFHDHSAPDISKRPDFKLLKHISYEEAIATHNACDSGSHDMIVEEPAQFNPYMRCQRCGLSVSVMLELCGHNPEMECSTCGKETGVPVAHESGVVMCPQCFEQSS